MQVHENDQPENNGSTPAAVVRGEVIWLPAGLLGVASYIRVNIALDPQRAAAALRVYQSWCRQHASED